MTMQPSICTQKDFEAFIQTHCKEIGLEADVPMEKLFRYCTELLKWNKKIRLTAAVDLDDLTRNHIADALHLVQDLPPHCKKALDVGSGGGLPVIPFAIITPHMHWTSIETIGKKTAFLNHIKRSLSLDNFISINCRYEDHVNENPSYDLAISRAVWAPDIWLKKAKQAIQANGRVLILEAKTQVSDTNNLKRRHYVVNGRDRTVATYLHS